MTDLVPNSIIRDRFLIAHVIDRGVAGELYLAIDQQKGKAVALKRFLHGGDESLAAAFERESEVLGRFRHKAIPRVIDHFVDTQGLFLVFEYANGDDLATKLEAALKPFPLSWVVYWADQLLDALNRLHTNDPPIFHPDIRPRTMKLTERNEILLIDLGLTAGFCAAIRSARGNVNVLDGGSVGFTPLELVKGARPNSQSDLYSLAASFYQLLTGRMPADSVSRAGAMNTGSADPLAPLHVVDPSIPTAISGVFMKALAVDPGDRYSSASEMQSELRRAHSGIAQSAVKTAVLDRRDAEMFVGERQTEKAPADDDAAPDAATLVMNDVEETVRLAGVGNVESPRSDFEPTIVMDLAGSEGHVPNDQEATQIISDPNAETIAVADGIGSETAPEAPSSVQPTLPLPEREIRSVHPESRIAVDLANSVSGSAGVSETPVSGSVSGRGGKKLSLLPIIGVSLGLLVLVGGAIAVFMIASQLNTSAPANAIPSTPVRSEPADQKDAGSATPDASPTANSNSAGSRSSNSGPSNLQPRPDASRTPPPSNPKPAQPAREPSQQREPKAPTPKNTPKPKNGDDRTVILQ